MSLYCEEWGVVIFQTLVIVLLISSEEHLFYRRLDILGFSPVACTVHIKQHSSLHSVSDIFVHAKVSTFQPKFRNVKQIAHQMIK